MLRTAFWLRREVFLVAAVVIPVSLVGGAWLFAAQGEQSHARHVDLASLPEDTAARYRFVESRPDLAERIPCYCGCGKSLGHQSLKDCYLAPGGYSDHAVACLICGRIALDLERLSSDGYDIAAIRSRIDETYAEFGPPTLTP